MENMRISLKAARVNAECTTTEAANYMGVSRTTISNWETGITEPTITQAEKLAKFYGLPVDHIIFLPSKSNKI